MERRGGKEGPSTYWKLRGRVMRRTNSGDSGAYIYMEPLRAFALFCVLGLECPSSDTSMAPSFISCKALEKHQLCESFLDHPHFARSPLTSVSAFPLRTWHPVTYEIH